MLFVDSGSWKSVYSCVVRFPPKLNFNTLFCMYKKLSIIYRVTKTAIEALLSVDAVVRRKAFIGVLCVFQRN